MSSSATTSGRGDRPAEQRITLVTGASRGIGRTIAERLAREGHLILNLDVREPEGPVPGEFHPIDFTDRAATARVLEKVTRSHSIDNLVNNAAIVRPAGLAETRLEDFEAVVQVNLRAVIQCAQACLPAMVRRKRGRIVNISSRAALGKELRTAYSATKAGILGLTRTWALELAREGITVNAIAPGPIETELFRQSNPAESDRTKALLAGIPMGRLGTPDDVAAAAAFFVSDDAAFITGQTLYVCGGSSVGQSPA